MKKCPKCQNKLSFTKLRYTGPPSNRKIVCDNCSTRFELGALPVLGTLFLSLLPIIIADIIRRVDLSFQLNYFKDSEYWNLLGFSLRPKIYAYANIAIVFLVGLLVGYCVMCFTWNKLIKLKIIDDK